MRCQTDRPRRVMQGLLQKGIGMVNDDTLPGVNLGVSPADYAPQKLVEVPSDPRANLRQLSFRYMQDGFSIVDGDGLHVDVNPAFCSMTGYSEQELLGSHPRSSYWPPEEYENIEAEFSRAFSGESSEVELTFKRKNGERFPVIVNPFAIRDQGGDILYYAGTVKEITQRLAMEAALQEKEARYRALFESAGDAIVIMQGDQIVDCNSRALELTGRSREEMLSNPTVDYFPPTQPNGQDSQQFFLEKVIASRVDGPQRFEWTGLIAGDVPMHTDVTLTTFMLGSTLHIQSIMRDITQRKRLEDALAQRGQQYRSLFEHAGDGILIMEGEKVLDCNQRLLDIYGISREDLMGRSDYSLSPHLQPNGQSSQAFFAEKVSAVRPDNPQTFQWSGTKLDGTPIQTEVTLTTVMLDGKACAQSLIRDVTRRRQLEDALVESELRYRTLFDSAGDAIAIHKDFRTIDCNQRMLELYGLSREEILSSTVGDYFPPAQPNGQDSREFFLEKLMAARAGNPQIYEWHGRKRDGTLIITEINLTSFTIGGETYDQAIARDITKRKQLEAALRDLNKTLEDRVVQRTDELEKVCAELLQRNDQFRALAARLTQAEDEERRRIAQVLHDNHQQLIVAAKFRVEILQGDTYCSNANEVARQVLEILDQALAASRSLTMELAPPILYGAGLVVALQWLARWMEENYKLEVAVHGTLPMTRVPTEVSTLLFQAVRELLFNVIKHSGVRKATVSVLMEHNLLVVTVADEGAGFEVAAQLETPRSFGLFSIQERLALLGGQLDIVSRPGSGTVSRMAITLPASQEPVPDVAAQRQRIMEQAVHTPSAHVGDIRILVTDDHAPSRASLMQILGLVSDFEIVGQAVDGLDALEKVRLLQPDVVLMDVTMPRLNGLEATRRITREYPGVKVLGFSMLGSEEIESYMLAAGATRYLHKSSPADDLIAAIRAAMGGDSSADTTEDDR
jgi:PAS domain S-box-containing protein